MVTCRTASYYDVTVDGDTVADVAWYYPRASEKAKNIEGYVAFYKVCNVSHGLNEGAKQGFLLRIK